MPCAAISSASIFASSAASFSASGLKRADRAVLLSRRVGELDNRGSHFYLALYWAQALARRDNSTALSARFKPLAEKLAADEAKIDAELIAAQGKPADTGGYYRPDQAKTSAAMRPSATLNAALAAL